jgi:hypothetical protein
LRLGRAVLSLEEEEMTMAQWEDKLLPCPDEECPGQGEPDGDAELRYHSCNVCGYEWNYERISEQVLAEDGAGNCSIGVPEGVRRASSAPMELAMRKQAQKDNVTVIPTIGFGPPKE